MIECDALDSLRAALLELLDGDAHAVRQLLNEPEVTYG